jgi:hypothetical protein
MLAASHGSRGEPSRVWQEMSSAFASSIALEAQRLATHIQGQFAEHLYFMHRVHLPIWVPNYTFFTSAHWAERLVSSLYNPSHSLWSIFHEAPPLCLEPSSFVWFRRGWGWRSGWPATRDEGQPTEIMDEVWSEEPSLMLGTSDFRQPTLPNTGGRHRILSDQNIGATLGLNAPRQEATLLMLQAPYLVARWPEIRIRHGSLAQRDVLPSKGSTPYLTDLGLFAGEESGLAGTGGRASGAPRLPESYGQVSAMKRYVHFAQPIRPTTAINRTEESLAGAQKALDFSHRIFATPTRMSSGEEVMPLSLSAVETGVRRFQRLGYGAMTTIGRETPGGFEEQFMPWLPTPLFDRQEDFGSSYAVGGSQQAGGRIYSRWPLLRATISPELAKIAPETRRRMCSSPPPDAGLEYDTEESILLTPGFAFPSRMAIWPKFAKDFAEQTLLTQTSQEFVFPHHKPDSAQGITISAPQLLTEKVGIGGGRSYSGGPPHEMAFAPLGRPKGSIGNSSAMSEPEVEGAMGRADMVEEPAKVDFDKLARDVYAILKRRLAWEKEHSLSPR